MKLFRLIPFLITQLTLLPSYFYLVQIKRDQKKRFETLKNQYSLYSHKLSGQNDFNFTVPIWQNYIKKLEKTLLPYPSFSFLRERPIRETMFVMAGGKWIKDEISFIEKSILKENLRRILEEDYIGGPILINSTYLTSHNSIHHLYHLLKFQEKTKINFSELKTIIEWGGGYGNMAKLFKRLVPDATYIIIDLPLLSCLQWLYLATILGEEAVNLLSNTESKFKEGKINILPICFLKHHVLNCDLFIATWSLSESSKNAQKYVDSCNFFGAEHLLLGFQESGQGFSDAARVEKIAKSHGAFIYPIEFLPGNYYAFK